MACSLAKSAVGHNLGTLRKILWLLFGYVQRVDGRPLIRRRGHPQQSKSFPLKSNAELWAKTVESEIGRGVFTSAVESERTTLSDLIKRFQVEFAPHHYRVRGDGKEAWRYQCARLNEAMGAYHLAAIDQKIVAKYRDDRIKGDGGRAAVGESTVRKELYMLAKILGFAETGCRIALPRGNPVDKIRKPTEGRSRDRRLTADEMSALID